MENGLLHVVLFARKNTSLNIIHGIKSIKNQTYKNIRLLVVDRNPADSMYSLGLQEDLALFQDIDYLQNNELAIGELYNQILNQVDGSYIGFMTSNDVWNEKKVQLQISQLELEENVAATCSSGLFIDKRERNIVMESFFEKTTYDSESWLVDNPARMSSQVIYKIKHLREVGGFDTKLTNLIHGDMLIRLSKKYKVRFMPLELCQCSITNHELSYDKDSLKDRQKLYVKYLEAFIKSPKLKSDYLKKLIGLAKKNFMWLNYFGYVFLYCLNAPIEVISLQGKKLLTYVQLSLRFIKEEYSFLVKSIQMKVQTNHKYIYQEDVNVNSEVLKKEEDGNAITSFHSAKEFNRYNYINIKKKNLRHVAIPEYVTTIKSKLFFECETLEKIQIPNTVTEIGAFAFYGCTNLKDIVFEEGSRITNIGNYAFGLCKSLRNLTLPSNLAILGKGVFFQCVSLEDIVFASFGKEETSTTFPSGLTKIDAYTFARCLSLKGVEFSMGSILQRIEKGAFLGCTNLEQVVLTGKVSSLGPYSFSGCTKLKTLAIVQIDAIQHMGRGAFYNCKSLEYFNLSKQLTKIAMRTFYGCSRLPIQKVPKTVLAIGYEAYRKCSRLDKVILYSKDITISPTAFEKHTDIEIK